MFDCINLRGFVGGFIVCVFVYYLQGFMMDFYSDKNIFIIEILFYKLRNKLIYDLLEMIERYS